MPMNPARRQLGRARPRASLVLAALLVAACLSAAPAGAGGLQAAQARLTSLENEIKQQEADIALQHRRLATLGTRLAQLQATQQATTVQLLATQRLLADTQTRYRALQERLGTVARTAYEQGSFAPVSVVLGATSLTDLMDRLTYLDAVQSANTDIAYLVAHQAAKLRFEQTDLNALSERQAKQTNQLQAQRAQLLVALLNQQQQLANLAAARRQAARLVRILSLPPDPGITGAGVTFGHWAELFLAKIGAPLCQDNKTLVVAWEAAEGTAAAYNPLATTHDFPGATIFNSSGVKNYPTLQAGLQATVDTLTGGATTHGYGAILTDLAGCAPAETTATAVNASDWCRGCAGGMYVLDILPLVEADYSRFADY